MNNNTDIQVIPPLIGKGENVKLTTIGEIKGQIANVYRACGKGLMDWSDGTKAVYILRQALKAVEVEMTADLSQRMIEASADGEDKQLIFSGVKVISPPTQPTKGKANGKGKK